jgi:hypothetical protein
MPEKLSGTRHDDTPWQGSCRDAVSSIPCLPSTPPEDTVLALLLQGMCPMCVGTGPWMVLSSVIVLVAAITVVRPLLQHGRR